MNRLGIKATNTLSRLDSNTTLCFGWVRRSARGPKQKLSTHNRITVPERPLPQQPKLKAHGVTLLKFAVKDCGPKAYQQVQSVSAENRVVVLSQWLLASLVLHWMAQGNSVTGIFKMSSSLNHDGHMGEHLTKFLIFGATLPLL